MAIVFVGVAHAQDDWKTQFAHDFRGRTLPPGMEAYQATEDGLLRLEPDGLRITLPRTYMHKSGGVGVRWPAFIQGDFEATTTVEIIELEPPPKGSGAGIGISVSAGPSKGEQLRRVVGAKGKHALLRTGYFRVPEKKNLQWEESRTPCDEKTLRLRLQRIGPTIIYSWSPGASGGAFIEVHRKEFGTDEIEAIRVFAVNAQQPCLVDVRVFDLQVRTRGEGAKSAPLAAPLAPQPDRSGWLAAALCIGISVIAILAASIGVFLFLRRISQS
jgi:hypothetical protein